MLPQAHRFAGNLVVIGNRRLRPKMLNKFLKCVHVPMIHFFTGNANINCAQGFFGLDCNHSLNTATGKTPEWGESAKARRTSSTAKS